MVLIKTEKCTKYKPKPKTRQWTHKCVHIIVHTCHTQHSKTAKNSPDNLSSMAFL